MLKARSPDMEMLLSITEVNSHQWTYCVWLFQGASVPETKTQTLPHSPMHIYLLAFPLYGCFCSNPESGFWWWGKYKHWRHLHSTTHCHCANVVVATFGIQFQLPHLQKAIVGLGKGQQRDQKIGTPSLWGKAIEGLPYADCLGFWLGKIVISREGQAWVMQWKKFFLPLTTQELGWEPSTSRQPIQSKIVRVQRNPSLAKT